jgi:hypothetical protein
MNGFSGSLTAVAPTPAELSANGLYHGFLTRDGYAWKLSDGTPFLAVGDTAWSFSEEVTTSEWQAWMSARQAQHFNTFLGCVWLAIYSRTGVPEAFAGKNPQTDSPNVDYFQRLDTMVQYANDHGIMMGLTIGGFPGNSSWWSKFNTQARDDRWFRYCVARYTAYNVRWCLYGEVSEANPSWGSWQNEVLHKAQLIKDEDPYDHPIGSHNTTIDSSSIGNANIDYLEVQIGSSTNRTETQYTSALNYRTYGKPIWFEEYWYEAQQYNEDNDQGIRNTHRNFVHAMAFPTFGSWMRQHFGVTAGLPDISQVGNDPGAIRMGYFHEFYKNLDSLHFTPSTGLVSSGQCGKFGDNYAIFKASGGSFTLNLSGVSGSFDVTKMDIRTGATASLGTVAGGGTRTIDPGTSSDVAILVVKSGPATNTAPSVDAGGNSTIKLGELANLDGTVNDDGLPSPPSAVTTLWTKLSGPGTVSFTDAAAVDTTAGFTAIGVYVLQLTASDGELAASDTVTVTVNSNVPADGDNDGDVDMVDFGLFQVCMTGSGETLSDPACEFADLDHDETVDAADATRFIACLGGSGVLGNPQCAG